MYDLQRQYFIDGSSWASRIGIRGIQAAMQGQSESAAYAEELGRQLGGFERNTWLEWDLDLPNQAAIATHNVILLFSGGARSARHGSNVMEGMVETFEGGGVGQVNSRVAELMYNRWNQYLRIRDYADFVILFGHSYGGVCVEALGERLARSYPSTRFRVETFGSPRACIPSRIVPRENLRRTRNLHVMDVVSHIPYTAAEAPLAASMTSQRYMRAFNASGHGCLAKVFTPDGRFEEIANNVMPVRDTSVTIASWLTYSQHLTHRAHELATYVSLMDAYAARSEDGQCREQSVSGVTTPPYSVNVPTVGEEVSGVPPTVSERNEYLAEKERLAIQMEAALVAPEPARPYTSNGVAGVRYRGQVRVEASNRRAARIAAKRLNRLRKILSPCTTEQRAQMLEALELDIQGPL